MNRLRLAPLFRRSVFAAMLAWCCAAAGCTGGQTGGESPAGASGGCDVEHRELTWDEPTPLGASAASVLAPVLGTNTAAMLWSANTGALTAGPEQGLSQVELVVTYAGGRIAWAHFVNEADAADAGFGGSLGCAVDRLEVELELHLRTAGGALDEQFVATGGAVAADSVQLSTNLPLDELAGSLFVVAPEGVIAAFVNVTASWDAFGFRGALMSGVETISRDPNASGSAAGGSVGFGFVPLAAWPPPRDGSRP